MLPFSIEENVRTQSIASVVLERRDSVVNNDTTKLTHFQQIFAAFCVFVTEICILLFFLVSNLKLAQLLITTTSHFSNQIQREFLFNNCIQSYSPVPASSHLCQKNKPFQTNFDSNVAIRTFDYEPSAPKTNLFKLFTPFPCEAGRPAVTSRGQEERVGDACFISSILLEPQASVLFQLAWKRKLMRPSCRPVQGH
jgi:hypothetical protein